MLNHFERCAAAANSSGFCPLHEGLRERYKARQEMLAQQIATKRTYKAKAAQTQSDSARIAQAVAAGEQSMFMTSAAREYGKTTGEPVGLTAVLPPIPNPAQVAAVNAQGRVTGDGISAFACSHGIYGPSCPQCPEGKTSIGQDGGAHISFDGVTTLNVGVVAVGHAERPRVFTREEVLTALRTLIADTGVVTAKEALARAMRVFEWME
jgi:hypothetical protein